MFHVVHLCEWLTLSHVSKEGNKRKRKKIKKNCGEDMWHVGEESRKVGRKLPHLDNSVDMGEKEENPNKRRRKKRK